MARCLIVDGYNVIKRDALLQRIEAKNLAEAREVLIARLANAPALRQDRITVVFDGWDSGNVRETKENRGRIAIIYSRHGERADEVIKRLAEEAQRKGSLLVVTDDAEICRFVRSVGQETAKVPRRSFQPRPRFDDCLVKEEDIAPPPSTSRKGNPRQPKKKRDRQPSLW